MIANEEVPPNPTENSEMDDQIVAFRPDLGFGQATGILWIAGYWVAPHCVGDIDDIDDRRGIT